MVGHVVKQFDEASIPVGKRYRDKDGKVGFEKALALEGKYTRIAYKYPADRSSLEVMRNYQAALDKAGMTTVFACAKESCGKDFGDYFVDGPNRINLVQGSTDYIAPFNFGRNDKRYLVAAGKPDGYKIDARRLSPKGVASYAPLASNRLETGREKNRCVELVEQ